jgi:hypothetical protein
VCRGATIWGSDYHRARRNTQQIGSVNLVLGTTIKSRIARCSYGLIINVPFKDGEHRIEDRFFDKFKGISCAKNQMHWLLKRVCILLV